jgi:hypothetical protein
MYSPTCGVISDSPNACDSPSYFAPKHDFDNGVGSFRVIKKLQSGVYGSTVAARDLRKKRRVCLKVIDKTRVEGKAKELHAMRTELMAYKMIASSKPNAHIMDCHGVYQDEDRVFFAMVSPFRRALSPIFVNN